MKPPLVTYRDALQALQDAEACAAKCGEDLAAAQKASDDAQAAVAKARQISESAHAVLCAAIAKGTA